MIHIGAGGWGYFNVPGIDLLSAYAKAFDFVEVNSTFYSTPSISMVKSWRRRVPFDFVFSVKCHKDLTHKYLLSPCERSLEILNNSLQICRELKANFLLIQTPPTFDPDEKQRDIKDLMSGVDFGNVQLSWEIRGKKSNKTVELMRELGIIHCTDISREMPALDSDILYTRLFGHGEHNMYQFDDQELTDIDTKIRRMDKKEAYITFHGSRMYKDAARLKMYLKNGIFPNITNKTGLASLEVVLKEDTDFPDWKNELVKRRAGRFLT
jgi:uncharacterized protein YecE (DUF72 family)